MFDWLKKREPTAAVTFDEDADKRRGRYLSGTYRALYQYLEHRYANTVVLTFGQIEDLLGFKLPDEARTDREWWTVADANIAEARYSHAWTMARRTARPNLLAKHVTFERAVG
jgi:hypothetical protein